MQLVKPLIVVSAALLMATGVATAGAATRQQDGQQLKDAGCTTAIAAKSGAQDGTKAQDRLQLQDGSCLTAVAYHSGTQSGTGAHDHQRLHDGSCLTA